MKKQKQPANATKQFPRVLVLTFTILLSSVSRGQEWIRFRGPNGQGISIATTIPVKWTPKDYNWKVSLPGGGNSSPVIWGDKVFITSGDEKAGRGILLALQVSDGTVLWQKKYALTPYRMNRLNKCATGTPVLDANNVYVLWTTSQETILEALDHDGEEIWRRTFGGVHCQHGPATSPMLFDDIVVFTQEHEGSGEDGRSVWIAVDRKTGRTRWELERQTGPKTSYSTPCVYSPPTGASQLIFTSRSHGITSVNPRTGTVIWEAGSVFPSRTVSSPVIADGLIIGTCGDGSSGKCLVAIHPGTTDKSTQPSEAYTIDRSTATYAPTPLAIGGLLFTYHDRGYVSCLRSDTGEQLWREKPSNRIYGSPVWADGKLYCITAKGEVLVIKAAPTYELLAVNPLGEESNATPAIADGRMYLRTYSQLISIGPR